MQQVTIEDDYGVVFLCDFDNSSSDPPEYVADRPAWATSKMVAISVLHYTDDSTSIALGSEMMQGLLDRK